MDHLLALTGQAQATHFWFHGFRSFVRPVLHDLAAGRRDLLMVDCGCGTGHNLALLRPYGRAVGFDLTAGGLALAAGSHTGLVRADATRTPYRDATFDLATSFDVLQCVPDDRAAVGEMARIVRPGGAVVATLAALDMLSGDHAAAWQEMRRYTPRTARALFEGAGLSVERVSYMFASLFPLMLSVRVAQRLLRPFRSLRPDTDIAVPAAPVNAALTALVRTEAMLWRHMPMPIGSSLLVVARRGRAA